MVIFSSFAQLHLPLICGPVRVLAVHALNIPLAHAFRSGRHIYISSLLQHTYRFISLIAPLYALTLIHRRRLWIPPRRSFASFQGRLDGFIFKTLSGSRPVYTFTSIYLVLSRLLPVLSTQSSLAVFHHRLRIVPSSFSLRFNHCASIPLAAIIFRPHTLAACLIANTLIFASLRPPVSSFSLRAAWSIHSHAAPNRLAAIRSICFPFSVGFRRMGVVMHGVIRKSQERIDLVVAIKGNASRKIAF